MRRRRSMAILQQSSSNGNSSPDWLAKLQVRRIFLATVEAFDLSWGADPHTGRLGWNYSVPKGGSAKRFKDFESSAEPKCKWLPTKPESARYYYQGTATRLKVAIQAAEGVLWIASGEPDVWALWEAGIQNALSWYGEGSIPTSIAGDLKLLGVREVHWTIDLDEAGYKAARKLRTLLADSGIVLIIHRLPGEEGSGYDVGKAWIDYHGAVSFVEWLAALPILELPETPPDEINERHPYEPSELPSDASERLEVERRVRAEIANRLRKRGQKPGYYDCPFDDHGPRGKDFLFDPEVDPEGGHPIGGCQGKHAKQLTRWVDLAEYLGIDVSRIARDVAAERRRDLLGHSPAYPNNITLRRFPHGLPITLNDRLIGAHLKFKHLRIKSQHPAALGLLIWQELRDIIPDDAVFTAGQFQKWSEDLGRNLTRRTVDSFLEQATAWGLTSCTFCDGGFDLSITERLSISGSKCTTDKAGPGEKLYQFLPIDEQLDNFERHWRYLLREIAYADIPDNVQAEWADLTTEEIALLDEARSPVYAEYADRRCEAEQRLITHEVDGLKSQLDKFLDSNLAAIRTGRYQAVRLNPGALPNTKAYRQALLMQPYHDDPEYVRENANRTAARKAGATRATISRYREELGLVLEERTREVPAQHVTEYQREHGLVLKEDNGVAVVRVACAERLASHAPEETVKTAEKRKASARRRHTLIAPRRADLDHRPQEPPALTSQPDESLSEAIPPAYSDQHVLRQFEFTPGAADIRRCEVDLETGEILRDYTPQELWRLLAERICAAATAVLAEEVSSTMPYDPRTWDEVDYQDRPPRASPPTARPIVHPPHEDSFAGIPYGDRPGELCRVCRQDDRVWRDGKWVCRPCSQLAKRQSEAAQAEAMAL